MSNLSPSLKSRRGALLLLLRGRCRDEILEPLGGSFCAGPTVERNKMSKKYHGMPEEIKAPSRRTFLQQLLGTSLASAAGVALLPRVSWAGKGPTTPPPPQGTGQQPQTGGTGKPVAGAQGGDLDVLNFALLLEQLEAAF